jgi:hypothetical protein
MFCLWSLIPGLESVVDPKQESVAASSKDFTDVPAGKVVPQGTSSSWWTRAFLWSAQPQSVQQPSAANAVTGPSSEKVEDSSEQVVATTPAELSREQKQDIEGGRAETGDKDGSEGKTVEIEEKENEEEDSVANEYEMVFGSEDGTATGNDDLILNDFENVHGYLSERENDGDATTGLESPLNAKKPEHLVLASEETTHDDANIEVGAPCDNSDNPSEKADNTEDVANPSEDSDNSEDSSDDSESSSDEAGDAINDSEDFDNELENASESEDSSDDSEDADNDLKNVDADLADSYENSEKVDIIEDTTDASVNVRAIESGKHLWNLTQADFEVISSLVGSHIDDSTSFNEILQKLLSASSPDQLYNVFLTLSKLSSTLLFDGYCAFTWDDLIVPALKEKVTISENTSITFGRLLAEMFVKMDSIDLFKRFVEENQPIRAYYYVPLAASHGSLKIIAFFAVAKKSPMISWDLSRATDLLASNFRKASPNDDVATIFDLALVNAVEAEQMRAINSLLEYGANPMAFGFYVVKRAILLNKFAAFKVLIMCRPGLVNDHILVLALEAESDDFAVFLLNHRSMKLFSNGPTLLAACTSKWATVREASFNAFRSLLTPDVIVSVAVEYMKKGIDEPEPIEDLVRKLGVPTLDDRTRLVRAAFGLKQTLNFLLKSNVILTSDSWKDLVMCSIMGNSDQAISLIVSKFTQPSYKKRLTPFLKVAIDCESEQTMLILISNADLDDTSLLVDIMTLLKKAAAKGWWQAFERLAIRVQKLYRMVARQSIIRLAFDANQNAVVESLIASGYPQPTN